MNDLNLMGVDVPPEVLRLIEDDSTSDWLRAALWKSLTRDPLDALNDAEALVDAVEQWVRGVFRAAGCEIPARAQALKPVDTDCNTNRLDGLRI